MRTKRGQWIGPSRGSQTCVWSASSGGLVKTGRVCFGSSVVGAQESAPLTGSRLRGCHRPHLQTTALDQGSVSEPPDRIPWGGGGVEGGAFWPHPQINYTSVIRVGHLCLNTPQSTGGRDVTCVSVDPFTVHLPVSGPLAVSPASRMGLSPWGVVHRYLH